MAGILKPDIKGLGIEGKIEFSSDYQVEGNEPSTVLVDGIINNHIVLNLYSNGSKSYFYFTIKQNSTIWSLSLTASDSGGYYDKPVQLYRIENGNSIPVGIFPTKMGVVWYKLFDNIPSGTYKVESTAKYSNFIEWYVETISQFLLKSNDKYYSINSEFYDPVTKTYLPLSELNFEKGFSPNQLTESVTINGETFLPIDKFNNFQLVSDKEQKISVTSLKSFRELIVASNDVFTSIAQNINYFKLYANNIKDSNIKIAISIDSGNTWNTIKNSAFTSLPCNIPKKSFESLTNSELIEWNNARDIIFDQGISIDIFNSLDFNTLNSDELNYGKIRFAYVLEVETPTDIVETNKLEWKFDSKGSMKLLKDNEYEIDLHTNNVKFKSLIDNPIVKINVLI